MGFSIHNDSLQSFKISKIIILNKKGWITEYTIQDYIHKSPYLFECPVCLKSSIDIDSKDLVYHDNLKIKIEAIENTGGTGFLCQLISCQNCNTFYFVGIGYTEPNNGRDVLFIHNILQLVEI